MLVVYKQINSKNADSYVILNGQILLTLKLVVTKMIKYLNRSALKELTHSKQ